MASKVGFVGLGAMGGPMARNLLKAGVRLVVHDIDAREVQALPEAGAEVAHSPEAVAKQCGHTVICMSTVDVTVLQHQGTVLAEQGISLVDAPVSGGTTGAAAGTLSVIVGGPAESFTACEDLFRAMGKNVFHMGGLGSGLAMKLINNMLLQVQAVAIAEGMVLGTKAGLDPVRMIDVLRVSTGQSMAVERSGTRMVARDFSPSGTTDISFKVQELETALAKVLGVPMLLANVTQQFYQMARAAGYGKEDGSSMVKVTEKLAGVTVGGLGA